MTRRLYDASSPPPDPHLDVCGFYIGGDTPHVWTDAEINAQSARWRLPIYTCDNPGQRDPVADATAACAWMIRHQVPKGSALGLDYETAINAAYVTTFDRVVRGMGWTVLLYGSLSSVVNNPRPSAGYWTASWTTVPHLDNGAAATQYISDTQLGRGYDLSEVTDSLVLWDTRPPAPTPPPPKPLDATVTHIISVTPDPTLPAGNTTAGLFLVDGGRVIHIAEGTYAEQLEAKFGQPLAATTADYQAHLAAMEVGVVTVDAAALGAAIAAGLKFPTEFTGTLS